MFAEEICTDTTHPHQSAKLQIESTTAAERLISEASIKPTKLHLIVHLQKRSNIHHFSAEPNWKAKDKHNREKTGRAIAVPRRSTRLPCVLWLSLPLTQLIFDCTFALWLRFEINLLWCPEAVQRNKWHKKTRSNDKRPERRSFRAENKPSRQGSGHPQTKSCFSKKTSHKNE